MCGIVGYIGSSQAWPIIINGLRRLEYRGYDSAGVALLDHNKLKIYKCAGKVTGLEQVVQNRNISGSIGIGHTRWATHGEPTDTNAHPHISNDGYIALVHNGIIENYLTLRNSLVEKGYNFQSETDTEVLTLLIEHIKNQEKCGLAEAVRLSLSQVVGAYAIAVIDSREPDTIIAARKGSPLVIGVGEGEYIVGSDATALAGYTKNIIYLKDFEIASITNNHLQIRTIENEIRAPSIQELKIELEALEKRGFDHFMLKEIHEQAETVRDCMRGRVSFEKGTITLGGLQTVEERLREAERIIFIACGTSWHAALIAEYLIEEFTRIPVEVEYASEFRYRNPIIQEGDVVIAISQSGETADTLAALQLAKEKRSTVLGICNVVGSSIPRLTDAGVYTHAGPEIGVASTKAFTAQLTVLTLLTLYIAQIRNTIDRSKLKTHLRSLTELPTLIEKSLAQDALIRPIARQIKDCNSCLFLGRGTSFPIALEGALKLKEISYIHAEGYPAGEMKHGPIALIDGDVPVIVIAPTNNVYEKTLSNLQEVRARKAKVIAIVSEGDETIREYVDDLIIIPECTELLAPLLSIIPLQLLAYHTALFRGCNVDQPRNLAKSVTVE